MLFRTRAAVVLLVCALAGCAGPGVTTPHPYKEADAFLGVYLGSFGSANTADPADDLNYVPCDPARERCLGGAEPLLDVLLELRRDPEDGAVRLAFYRSADDRARAVELDLLGPGCGSRIEPMSNLLRDPESGNRIAVFPLNAEQRLCLHKLRPTSAHEIHVELGADVAAATPFAQVLIDKALKSTNYLYVVEDGVERRVRIDLDNTVDAGVDVRYRVCIQDELGEYDRCVLTDKDMKRIVLPLPLPGGAAVAMVWWYDLTPDLQRTRGLYELEQYSGRFLRIEPADPG